VLWADRNSKKRSINNSPLNLVHGTKVILPVHLEIPVMKILQEIRRNERYVVQK